MVLNFLLSPLFKWGSVALLILVLLGRGVMLAQERDKARAEAMNAKHELQVMVANRAAADAGTAAARDAKERIEVVFRDARDLGNGTSKACADDPRIARAYDIVRRMRNAEGAGGPNPSSARRDEANGALRRTGSDK